MSTTTRPARWPWVVLALFIAIAIAASVVVVSNGESLAEQVPFIIAFAMFGVVGAMILSRARGNRVGSLLLWASMVTALAFLCGEGFTWLVGRGTSSGPLVVSLGLLSSTGWVFGIMPVLLFLPLLFPDGRLPSRRWRPLAWVDAVTLAYLAVISTVGVERLEGNVASRSIENPLFLRGAADLDSDVAISVLLLGGLAAGAASLVFRFRRASGIERQQIKWVAASAALILLSFLVSSLVSGITGEDNFVVDALLGGAAFLSLPVAVGVGVLQYRLYDLDVVVKKALVAGTLAVFVIVVYGGAVGVLGLATSGSEGSGWVFAIALALGLAFRPVSRFARRFADRLVYGRRATPYEVLTEFSERVGDAYATEDVLARMAQILGQGAGATSARVWLRVAGELRPVAAWPADAAIEDAPSETETTVEVRDKSELLGALSVEMPANDPMTPAKERLVNDLASQAGLVLRNVRLVEELRAAQRRLVTAQDHERRRLERNIHDGAQQQLVALSVKSRLAHGLVGRDPAKAQQLLTQIGSELETALTDLRDLARGIYPPLLADKGLGSALEAQANRSPLPVRVEADRVGRFAQELEAAVYFSCLEALQNVAKYAEASSASVRLARVNGHVTFEVEDDGRGFDPEATGYGTGLQGMADRIAAVGGRLEVRSAPGTGTTVRGEVPVAAEPLALADERPEAVRT